MEFIQFLSYRLGRFLAHDSPLNLLCHEAVDIPVVVCQLASVLKVAQDLLAESSELAGERNLCGINFLKINLAWLVKDHFWPQVLVGWLVLGVERALFADVAMLDPS